MKFRKKPVVIEAFQLTKEAALDCLINRQPFAYGLTVSGTFHPERREVSAAYVYIDTLEGRMVGGLGDWIIRGVKGELYPCKPEIFEATYEAANEAPTPAAPCGSENVRQLLADIRDTPEDNEWHGVELLCGYRKRAADLLVALAETKAVEKPVLGYLVTWDFGRRTVYRSPEDEAHYRNTGGTGEGCTTVALVAAETKAVES